MNILFISIAWPATGNRNLYSDLMDEFVSNGHRVHVAATRYDNEGGMEELSEENGIKVLRIHSGKIMKTSYLRKATVLLTLGRKLRLAIRRNFGNERYDLIIAPTPPITLSVLYKKLKRKYQAPFYLLLKDIWPQGSVDLNVFRKYSIPWFYFRIHERRLYTVANHIGTMSPLGAEYLRSKNSFIPPDKVEVCPNSIRPAELSSKKGSHEIRDKYGIPRDACVFIFSGNLGKGHGLHFMVQAIQELADYPNAYFVFGGAGTHYTYLESRLAESDPGNVFLYNWLPRKDFEDILTTSDVGLILLYKYTSPQFPSRLLSYLEYSKAVLCAVNEDTDIGSIVEQEGCGLSVKHGDLDAFVDAVKILSEQVSERKLMGARARSLIMDRYTATHSYEIIISHFNADTP
ncbi:MAG: glycosyltransferase family 4 protein [Bacteroidales bacterium]|nr:glycosyltransferase family 4 protein [Bacteroidales bacterium]